MADIFISYAHEDILQAQKLATEFLSHGWHVWMDTGIVVGADWRAEIQRELEHSRAVVVLWTDESTRSSFVKSEAEMAAGLGKLFPAVACDFKKLPLGLNQYQSSDVRDWFDSGLAEDLAELNNALALKLGSPAITDDNPYANAEKVKQLIKETGMPGLAVEARKLKGNSLAKFNDPRDGVGVNLSGLPDIQWIKIPAGDFIYGMEADSTLIELDDFYISKYPVTNRQFDQFVNAGGYQEKEFWRCLPRCEVCATDWPQINRPRVQVSWYEAVAFCRWLSTMYGYTIRLPDEHEWEKAARGKAGLAYPWGNEYQQNYANCDDSRIMPSSITQGEPVAVGLYPEGVSPYGVMDMAGNCWEWCLNKFEYPDDIEVDQSDAYRVIRGGCWARTPVMATGFFRYGVQPDNRDVFYTGIRLVTIACSRSGSVARLVESSRPSAGMFY